MNQRQWIPPATHRELSSPATPCGRHAQAMKIAASLAGQGLHADAIAAQLRTLYAAAVSDRELIDIKTDVNGPPKVRSRNRWLQATNITDTGAGVRVCLNPVHPAAAPLRNTQAGQLRREKTAT